MDGLEKFRVEIDEIDYQIMKLLEARFDVTNKVGVYKKEHNIGITHSNREDFILSKCDNYNYKNELKEVYKIIFTLSKNRQVR